jgi:hypothetical protein
MKCMYCHNVINNVSLDFYLNKYKEDLLNHRKNILAQNYNLNFHMEPQEKSTINRESHKDKRLEVEI